MGRIWADWGGQTTFRLRTINALSRHSSAEIWERQLPLSWFTSLGIGAKGPVVMRDTQGAKYLFLSFVLGACSSNIPETSPDLPSKDSVASAMLRSCACMLGTGPCADRVAGTYQVKNLKCEWNTNSHNKVQCSITERFVATRSQESPDRGWQTHQQAFQHLDDRGWCADPW